MNMTTDKKQSQFQSEIRLIHRSKIKNAPYNPRIQSDKAKKEVRKNIRKHGLMSTLTWNELSGNLVGGHLRLAQMDILEAKTNGDYFLSVSVVRLSDKEEKEQNIFLNSTTVQGSFDFSLLENLLSEIDPFAAGFDEFDLNIIGYDSMANEFETEDQNEAKTQLQKLDSKKKVKEAKERYKEQLADKQDGGESYVTLSFSSYESKCSFLKRFGINKDDLFIKGEYFSTLIERVN